MIGCSNRKQWQKRQNTIFLWYYFLWSRRQSPTLRLFWNPQFIFPISTHPDLFSWLYFFKTFLWLIFLISRLISKMLWLSWCLNEAKSLAYALSLIFIYYPLSSTSVINFLVLERLCLDVNSSFAWVLIYFTTVSSKQRLIQSDSDFLLWYSPSFSSILCDSASSCSVLQQ